MPLETLNEAEDEPEPERVRSPSQEQVALDKVTFDSLPIEAAHRTAATHDEVEASGSDSRAGMFGYRSNSDFFSFIADQHKVRAKILAEHAAKSAVAVTKPDGTWESACAYTAGRSTRPTRPPPR